MKVYNKRDSSVKKAGPEDSRLILLRRENRILSYLLTHGRLTEVNVYHTGEDSLLGNIYVGKVTNIVPNINAAFVKLGEDERCFLPMEHMRPPVLLNRRYDGRILAGDEILVQVEREAVKTKDAVAGTELSFSGRYAVVLPVLERAAVISAAGSPGHSGKISFSGKLPPAVKADIRTFLDEHKTSAGLGSFHVIVRTNTGELTDYAPLLQEIEFLSETARNVLSVADKRACFSCLYRPLPTYLTDIRDTYHDQYEKIITDDWEIYERIDAFFREFYPEESGKLSFYADTRPTLENLFGLKARLQEALEPRVWLKSGGYLVIEPTEALTAVDVNSGKYNGKREMRETFRLINHEAAAELARQLRLRNLSGIIIADFINMEAEEDRKELLRFLAQELKKDPVRTSVIDITPLGLVEITRKKVRKTLKEQFH